MGPKGMSLVHPGKPHLELPLGPLQLLAALTAARSNALDPAKDRITPLRSTAGWQRCLRIVSMAC